MKKIILVLMIVIVFVIFIFSTKDKKEVKKTVVKDNVMKAKSLTGLWYMKDTNEMAKFLDLSEKPKGVYCMQLDESEKKVYIKFLYLPQKYELFFNVTKDEGNITWLEFTYQNKKREAATERYSTSPDNSDYYILFGDEKNSQKLNKQLFNHHDGYTVTELYKTIDACIAAVKNDYENLPDPKDIKPLTEEESKELILKKK